MRIVFSLLLILVVIFGLSFAVENWHTVQFRYYVGSREIALSLLLVATLFAGALLGIAASLFPLLRLHGELRHLRKKMALASEEIQNLRIIPVRDMP